MADNEDKNKNPKKPISDDILFEVPTGLPTWAAELDDMPMPEMETPSSIEPIVDIQPPDLDYLELLSKVQKLKPANPEEELKAEPINIYSYQQETSEIPEAEDVKEEVEDNYPEPVEELIQETVIENVEPPTIEPAFFQQPPAVEFVEQNHNDQNFEFPVGEPEFLQQSSANEQDNQNFETPTIEPAFLQQVSVNEQDNSQDIEPHLESPLVSEETSITEFVEQNHNDQNFETPIGEPEFLQSVSENQSIDDTQIVDSSVEEAVIPLTAVIEETTTTGLDFSEQPYTEADVDITNRTLLVESLVVEQETPKQEINTQEIKDSQSVEDNINIELLPIENSTSNAEKIGPLESIIADIDNSINYLDFDLNFQGDSDVFSEGKKERYISFLLGETNYAIDAHNVIEVNKVPKITFVPNVTEWVLGVTNLRGDILSVIDMHSFLGLKHTDKITKDRLLVIRNNNHSIMTGVIVDEVKGLREIPSSKITSLPDFYLEEKLKPFFKGVYKNQDEILVLLDVELFLSSPEIRQFEVV